MDEAVLWGKEVALGVVPSHWGGLGFTDEGKDVVDAGPGVCSVELGFSKTDGVVGAVVDPPLA